MVAAIDLETSSIIFEPSVQFPNVNSTYQQLWNYAFVIGLISYEYKSDYSGIFRRGDLHLIIALYINGNESQKYNLSNYTQRKIFFFEYDLICGKLQN